MEPAADEFPSMPDATGRAEALEASASTIWTLLFLAYSSSTFLSEFGHGWAASWSIILVLLPIILAGLPNILDRRRHAVPIFISYIAYASVPALIQLNKPRDVTSARAELADLVTVLVLWLPLEFRLLSARLSPTGRVNVWGLLTAALTILNTFTVLRPLTARQHARPLGYTFKLTVRDFALSLPLAAICIAVTVPLASLMRFAKLSRRPSLREKPERELAAFAGLYMSALTEELLFRGLIQNMIEQRTSPNSLTALVLASLAYSAAHVSKRKLGFKPPNFRFAVCAFVSGIVYGLAWRLTGKVTGSAITHAIVDFALFRILFTEVSRTA